MVKEKFKRIPQKKKLSSLILTVPLNQFIHKSIEMWLVVLNSKNPGQKMPQSKKIDFRIFCEKLPLWFTIFSEF